MLLLLLLLLITVIALCRLNSRPKDFPPGPRGLPLLGYAPFIVFGDATYKLLQNLAKTYGPVTGFFMGPRQPFISVVGANAAKEALLNDDLIGRPSTDVIRKGTFGEALGIMFIDGEFWKEQRRFTLRHLRDFGFGRVESQMMDEVHDLIEQVEAQAASDPDRIVHHLEAVCDVSIVNVLWSIVGGHRFAPNDRHLKNVLSGIAQFFKEGNPATATIPIPDIILNLFPKLKKVFGGPTELFEPLKSFLRERIDEHLSTLDLYPRDFIDVYLMEIQNQAYKENPTFSIKQLVAIIQDLFAAGYDTTSNSIGFALTYLIHNPEVQRKMQAELDAVCGESLPTLNHRSNLVYTEAVLMEIQRMQGVAPIGVPHLALNETQLSGYRIPKGSVVMVNIDSALNDEAVWGDPQNFRPERHIHDDGKIIRRDALMPFGAGKRTCLGESLARNTFYLFVTALIKSFEFIPIADQPLPSLDPLKGVTLAPRPFEAIVFPRRATF